MEDKIIKLANRVYEYTSMDFDNEGTPEDAMEAIKNNPTDVIEFLLDLLDNYAE